MIGVGEPHSLNEPQSGPVPREVVALKNVGWSVAAVVVALRRHWPVLVE